MWQYLWQAVGANGPPSVEIVMNCPAQLRMIRLSSTHVLNSVLIPLAGIMLQIFVGAHSGR